ncbi:adenylate kinase [Acidobacteriota bacterium]
MRIVLLGAPGSGKGTQGDMIAKKYGFPRISTGDLLREEVAAGTPLGDIAKTTMDRGELVKDEFVLEMVDKRIYQDDCRDGYVLDGFPRNIQQAQKLERLDRAQEVVIEIFLEDDIVTQRLSSRRICPSCSTIYNLLVKVPEQSGICDACGGTLIQRDDDRPEVIDERLNVYHDQTEPLVDYYRTKGVFHRVNGDNTVQSVFDGICRVLDSVLSEAESRD